MKEKIHPEYFPDAAVICACGNTWTNGSDEEGDPHDVCSACHPFFTGEQRIVDTPVRWTALCADWKSGPKSKRKARQPTGQAGAE